MVGRRGSHRANLPILGAEVGQLPLDAVSEVRRHDEHHAHAHVEDAFHLGRIDPPELLHPGKHARHLPRSTLKLDLHMVGHDPGQIFDQAAAGDVGDAVHDLLHAVVTEHRLHRPGIEPRRFEQQVIHSLVA